MNKVISNSRVIFFDEKGNELMYIDHSFDECIWFFNVNQQIVVERGSELYSLLNEFMNNNYSFAKNELNDYKDANELVWHSDCYYNPDDELSIKDISVLHIKREQDTFNISCEKPIHKLLNITSEYYLIAFSPAGNGRYSYNLESGLTLQDDFVLQIYQKLLQPKVKKKTKISCFLL